MTYQIYQQNVKFNKQTEGVRHHRAKIQLGILFQSKFGYDVFFEVPSREKIDMTYYALEDRNKVIAIEPHPHRYDYQFDLLLGIKGYRNYENRGFVVVEVDGKIGHRTTRKDISNYRRDNHIWSKYGIPTVRFATEDIIGSKKLSEEELIHEYEYQILNKEDSYKDRYCFRCKVFWGPDRVKCECGGPTFKRKMIPIPPERRFDFCTWCGHRFIEHSVSGCNHSKGCDKCITGIIHSSDKKNG